MVLHCYDDFGPRNTAKIKTSTHLHPSTRNPLTNYQRSDFNNSGYVGDPEVRDRQATQSRVHTVSYPVRYKVPVEPTRTPDSPDPPSGHSDLLRSQGPLETPTFRRRTNGPVSQCFRHGFPRNPTDGTKGESGTEVPTTWVGDP